MPLAFAAFSFANWLIDPVDIVDSSGWKAATTFALELVFLALGLLCLRAPEAKAWFDQVDAPNGA